MQHQEQRPEDVDPWDAPIVSPRVQARSLVILAFEALSVELGKRFAPQIEAAHEILDAALVLEDPDSELEPLCDQDPVVPHPAEHLAGDDDGLEAMQEARVNTIRQLRLSQRALRMHFSDEETLNFIESNMPWMAATVMDEETALALLGRERHLAVLTSEISPVLPALADGDPRHSQPPDSEYSDSIPDEYCFDD